MHARSCRQRVDRCFVLGMSLIAVAILSCGSVSTAAEDGGWSAARDILKQKCLVCHNAVRHASGLRLDAASQVLAGGDSGPAVEPGLSDQSELIRRVTTEDESERMPPKGAPLTGEQIAVLRHWIDQGATVPPDEKVVPSVEQHWAFQPLRAPAIPAVRDRSWPTNAIDAFVLHRLEQEGWTPNPSAEPAALLRRAHLDLTGLPPSLAELQAYLDDDRPDAYLRLIDRLLAQPAYGERYARHWLDVVRYADSNGYERDAAKPEVWRYRDYVIRALNEDRPFDQFTREQLAGDEIPDATTETVLATGLHRLGPWDDEPADVAMDRYDQLDDMISTTSLAFLGLTIGCARCHDHKFEPLSQVDYYSLVAIFTPLDRPREGRTELTRPAVAPAALARAESPASGTVNGYFLIEKPGPVDPVYVLLRGTPGRHGDVVEPAVPAILGRWSPPPSPGPGQTSGRRLQLAHWIASPDNPLTARVIVNRVWQWHFGQGLVTTPNDFGLMGDRPTHPELLDYLAHWFVHEGQWSLKRLHRLIMTSRTYQMSHAVRSEQMRADPENRLLWRRSQSRLDAETIRDAMLAVSGRLDTTMYGPPIYPHVPAEALQNHADKETIWPAFDEQTASRRTVYAFIKRSLLLPMLEVLDFCDTTRSTGRRMTTTVPTQALTMFNGQFTNRQAELFADRLQRMAPDDPTRQIQLAWQLALSRLPSEVELAAATAFLREEIATAEDDASEEPADRQRRAMIQLCRTIVNLNEFVYPE
ncbi:MAG: PSD1 and planctomycete cytochrome C domain-containing protein [Pirellulales bacterium]